MTSAKQVPQHATEAPADTAQALQARLYSAFESGQDARESRQSAFDRLRADMEAGRFGGVALTGDAPSAMLTILDELNWPYSIDRFARCMPHFPVQFELMEMRGCLAQLGFGPACWASLSEAPHALVGDQSAYAGRHSDLRE